MDEDIQLEQVEQLVGKAVVGYSLAKELAWEARTCGFKRNGHLGWGMDQFIFCQGVGWLHFPIYGGCPWDFERHLVYGECLPSTQAMEFVF